MLSEIRAGAENDVNSTPSCPNPVNDVTDPVVRIFKVRQIHCSSIDIIVGFYKFVHEQQQPEVIPSVELRRGSECLNGTVSLALASGLGTVKTLGMLALLALLQGNYTDFPTDLLHRLTKKGLFYNCPFCLQRAQPPVRHGVLLFAHPHGKYEEEEAL